MRLKADLHTHTADDRHDRLSYSAETLVDVVAARDFDVLAIACHGRVVYTARLAEYARRRGVLLVPAVELLIERKHVVILNPSPRHLAARTFAALRAVGRRDAAFLAPHPFYPATACLQRALIEQVDLFDAVEYCSLYYPGVNFNRRAVRFARRHGLPLIGTSDTHQMPHNDATFTWIDAEAATTEAVVEAIRHGRTEVVTAPPPLRLTVPMLSYYLVEVAKYLVGLRSLGE